MSKRTKITVVSMMTLTSLLVAEIGQAASGLSMQTMYQAMVWKSMDNLASAKSLTYTGNLKVKATTKIANEPFVYTFTAAANGALDRTEETPATSLSFDVKTSSSLVEETFALSGDVKTIEDVLYAQIRKINYPGLEMEMVADLSNTWVTIDLSQSKSFLGETGVPLLEGDTMGLKSKKEKKALRNLVLKYPAFTLKQVNDNTYINGVKTTRLQYTINRSNIKKLIAGVKKHPELRENYEALDLDDFEEVLPYIKTMNGDIFIAPSDMTLRKMTLNMKFAEDDGVVQVNGSLSFTPSKTSQNILPPQVSIPWEEFVERASAFLEENF